MFGVREIGNIQNCSSPSISGTIVQKPAFTLDDETGFFLFLLLKNVKKLR